VPGTPDQSQPQTVPRARPQLGTDVERTSQSIADHTANQQRDSPAELGRALDNRNPEVGRKPNDNDVEHCAETGPLTKRDPQQQHAGADNDDHLTERERCVPGQALMKHIPWIESESRLDQHRHREPIQEQPEQQLRHPQRQTASAQLLRGCERWRLVGH